MNPAETAQSADASPQVKPNRSTLTLWILLAVCVLPFVASTALYVLSPPQARMNYGELIEPHPLAEFSVVRLDGQGVGLSDLKGKWTLIQVDGAECGDPCRDKLYKMRQVRLAQGKNMDRVQRMWLVTGDGPVDEQVQQAFEGTIMARAGDGRFLRQLPTSAGVAGHIWLIDPLGNVMLRYPPQADPVGIKNDLVRLLKVSQID